jgi:hypothetical protein
MNGTECFSEMANMTFEWTGLHKLPAAWLYVLFLPFKESVRLINELGIFLGFPPGQYSAGVL